MYLKLTVGLVVLLAVMLAAPAQAQKNYDVSPVDAVSSIGQCAEEDAEALPQGDVKLMQPPKDRRMVDDYTWGGDPDYGSPPYERWVHWWWYVMNVLYFYSCD